MTTTGKAGKDGKESTSLEEQRLCMLLLHNAKVKKVMDKYRVEMEKKKEAKQLGITLEELEKREAQVLEIPAPKKKKGKTSRANSKGRPDAKAKKTAANIGVEIFVKEKKDDKLEEAKQNADEETPESQDKQKGDSEQMAYQPGPIEAENTLEML